MTYGDRYHWFAGVLMVCGVAMAQPEPDNLDATDPMIRELVTARLNDVRQSPSSSTWMALAETYDANDFLTEATACYQAVIETDPENARAWYLLGLVLNDQGDVDAALDALRSAAQFEDYAPAHWRRGYWLLDEGRLDEAHAAFEQAGAVDAAQFGMARIAIARRDAETARRLLTPYLREGANLPYAHQLMATVFRLEGDAAAAGASMAIGVGAGPVWTDPWLRDVLLQETGFDASMDEIRRLTDHARWTDALELIDALLEQRPRDVNLLNYRGYATIGQGDRDGALAIWRDALEDAPDNYLLHLNLGAILAEDALRSGGDPAMSLDHLHRSIAANPNHARSHEVLGSLLNALGRTDEAVAPLERAYDLDPTNALLCRQLALLHLGAARWSNAERVLQRWTRLQPSSPEAHLRLAIALMELGRYDEALDEVVRSGLDPNHRDVRFIKGEIERRR